VDSKQPLIKYDNWRLFGHERTASFSWDHSYGPLDWPQRGIELFEVTGASRPLYWKTSVLDEFNGVAWERGDGVGGVLIDDARSAALGGASPRMVAGRPEWAERLTFSILGLRSPLAVTTGTTVTIDLEAAQPSAPDGTTPVLSGQELSQGTNYQLRAYAPDPSARLLRRRDDWRYPGGLERYTTIQAWPRVDVPGTPTESDPVNPAITVTAPVRGSREAENPDLFEPDPREILEGTQYERVAALADRLTRDAPGNYEAIAAVKRHLLENYFYDQDVPEHPDPLPAFLFEDRRGYCQQFSGAMALILRLAGIPSRVVSGFAPGAPDPDVEGRYFVRDTDAHSWVETWFPGVGWVSVDPTPSAAPARTDETESPEAPGATSGGTGGPFAIERSLERGRIDADPGSRDADEGSATAVLVWLAALLGVAGLVRVYRRRRALLISPEGAEPQLRELERALPLLGRPVAPGMTLVGIERELAATAGAPAASYPAKLRANRYQRRRPRRPGPQERRRLRRALARGGGPGRWLRALLAIPPGGPRRR
jgi:protein-glutamine gamma-glutamyltransferase